MFLNELTILNFQLTIRIGTVLLHAMKAEIFSLGATIAMQALEKITKDDGMMQSQIPYTNYISCYA